MKKEMKKKQAHLSFSYELFILLLSVLSIIDIFLPWFFKNPQAQDVILIMDYVLSFIFMGDFIYRLSVADSKKQYFFKERGWLDLLGSLPFPAVKIVRVFRILRSVNLIKRYGLKPMLDEANRNRANSAILIAIFLVILVLQFGGIFILVAESKSPNANIKDASDALWWIYVTITTVGYGDRYPVTNWGRIIGVIVMSTGIGLFAVLTGFLANTFLSPPADEKPKKDPVQVQLEKLTAAVEQLQKKTAKKG